MCMSQFRDCSIMFVMIVLKKETGDNKTKATKKQLPR